MVGLELVAQVPGVVVVDEDERLAHGQFVERTEDRRVLVGLAQGPDVELDERHAGFIQPSVV